MAYDDADHAIQTINAQLTGAAAATMQKFLMFRGASLRRVSALVMTAGTNAAAAVDVLIGTSTVATLAFGTQAAGSIIDSGPMSVEVPPGGAIELKGRANSATLVGAFQIQHQLDPIPGDNL